MSQKSYNNTPCVYLVPTPIGNMEDITYRAINVLNSVDVVFSEDTRVTLQLFKYFNINKKLISSHEYNELNNKKKLLSYLNNNQNVAIVTDQGTPIISDPGFNLVLCAIENNYNVVGLPGATALIPALISSGINPMPFMFYGFLNNKESKRKKELELLKTFKYTMIFYEAPHRITKTLENMLEIFGNRKVSLSREISKKYEEIFRGNLDEIIEQSIGIKGEIVIILEGNNKLDTFENITMSDHINYYIEKGYSDKEAIKIVSKERKLTKNIVYDEYHNIRRKK